jgi:ribosome-associated protein
MLGDMDIPEQELRFTFSRSSGAGGQNVNKVNTKATLHWDPATNTSIPDAVKERLRRLHPHITNDNGEVVIISQEHRTQRGNIEACRDKLLALLREASIVPKKRRKTKPTKGSVEKRLQGKKRDSDTKRQRRKDW